MSCVTKIVNISLSGSNLYLFSANWMLPLLMLQEKWCFYLKYVISSCIIILSQILHKVYIRHFHLQFMFCHSQFHKISFNFIIQKNVKTSHGIFQKFDLNGCSLNSLRKRLTELTKLIPDYTSIHCFLYFSFFSFELACTRSWVTILYKGGRNFYLPAFEHFQRMNKVKVQVDVDIK